MSEILTYWYMFPISIVIATIAMATGIGGAVFFSPLFILVLGLEPQIAVGSALGTELFGFTSGLVAYMRARLIDFKTGAQLLIASVPLAIAGSLFAEKVPGTILKLIFAFGIVFIAWQLYHAARHGEPVEGENEGPQNHNRLVTDRDGKVYRYTIKRQGEGLLFSGLGGVFVGMISAGLAELLEYRLSVRCRVPTPVAVATTIFVVVITVLAASIGHAVSFAQTADPDALRNVGLIVMYTIPGVIVGGQIGPVVQRRTNEKSMKYLIAGLFVVVGVIMLVTVIV